MKRVKYLLVTMLMVCLALAGCESQSANLVPGEYMGMTFGVPESWESEEDNHSLDYKSTYGSDSSVEFSLIISLRNIAEDTDLGGETNWNADVANKVIENSINGTYQYFDTYEALSTEEMVIDGHPALLHYFTLAAPDGEGKSNFESYVAGTEGQYVSILVKYEDAAQDITDTIKKDVDAFIKSIDLSDLDADAISAVWSPKSTPEPTIEPMEWVDMEYKGVKLSVPDHWESKPGDQRLDFHMDYEDTTLAIIQIIDLDSGTTWNEETADIVKEATMETYSTSPGYQFLSEMNMSIASEPGFVYYFLSNVSDNTVLYHTMFVVGKENYYVCVNFAYPNESSIEMQTAFREDRVQVIGSLDISGLPAYMETEKAMGAPLTILNEETDGDEIEYAVTAPAGFSDTEFDEIPARISMYDFMERYPISGIKTQIEPATIRFLSLSGEKAYSFRFEEAALRTKSKGPMTKDKMKEIAASAPSAEPAETKWVEQEYEGISFLLPDSWDNSENELKNIYSGWLSDGTAVVMRVHIHEMSDELDWESEAGRSVVQERFIEEAAEKDGYQAIDTEDIMIGGNPGFVHRYALVTGDKEDAESAMYCATVKHHFILEFDTMSKMGTAETAREELNETMEKILRSVDASGLE